MSKRDFELRQENVVRTNRAVLWAALWIVAAFLTSVYSPAFPKAEQGPSHLKSHLSTQFQAAGLREGAAPATP